MMLKVACIQMNAGPDIAANLDSAAASIRNAAAQGAQFIATPENTCHMRASSADKLASALPEDRHPALPLFSDIAKETGAWILAGSLSIKVSDDKIANRSFLFNDKGGIAAVYDKIHLFDVDLAGGETYRESATVRPGEKAITADTPWGRLGLSICYDVRFPHLYRTLAQAGARILLVPAAFTVPTGQAHWHTLLRARAIENGAFVIAPAQCGVHDGGRETYGHSLIISPWGDIIAEGSTAPGVIMAEIDLTAAEKARQSIPSLQHDRQYRLSS